ncbi:hypothetical protein jaqu_26600 [Jannaschia aquimarina]|uniref:Uncharacterized protein n=2 Tax=Jannaschia aquimarina TaxID=935700 RepID=A0A0D1D6D8_9RHOB|nr:hypothetical protein jaqu_26600 [Jannaschia aquimarina]SNT27005.1 hypothetical protein SAMN05421775_109115 [Jannaschia aquimarina]
MTTLPGETEALAKGLAAAIRESAHASMKATLPDGIEDSDEYAVFDVPTGIVQVSPFRNVAVEGSVDHRLVSAARELIDAFE